MTTSRPYRMQRRGASTAATRDRVLAATISLGYEELDVDPTLERIAARAGVSVQTVLRHFGTRNALLDAALASARAAVADERVPLGDDDPIAPLLAHYRRRAAFSLAMLAREDTDARAAAITDGGRRLHLEWVTAAYAPRLAMHPAAARPALVDLLVVATDVYTWKLLRLDRDLPEAVVGERMRTLVDAILAPH